MMNIDTDSRFSRGLLATSALIGVLTLSACASVEYRCPLDPSEEPESPTACAGMYEALQGARKGTGGKVSVFLDDQGRIVPPEMIEGVAAKPIEGSLQSSIGRYASPSGQPVFQNPKVFQVWSSSFVDANGNLHDGHSAWFATPGRWHDGSVDVPHVVGENVLRPTKPGDAPVGTVVPSQPYARQNQQTQPTRFQPVTQPSVTTQQDTQRSLEALGQAATSQQRRAAPQTAAGVTAPAVTLGN